MGSRSPKTILSLASLTALIIACLGCDANTACNEHFSRSYERVACRAAAEEIVPRIIQEQGKIPTGDETEALCIGMCSARYSAGSEEDIRAGARAPETDAEYNDWTNRMNDTFTACTHSCTAAIAYLRNQEKRRDNRDERCRNISGPQGITYCI